MICRTSRPRSAWSCATNMFWDTVQVTTCTTPAGAKFKLSCAHPRACPHFPFIPRPATTPRRTEYRELPGSLRPAACLLLLTLVCVGTAPAQIPLQATAPPPPPGQSTPSGQGGGKISLNVNLVVLHTSVLDDRGKFVDGLAQDNFRVYEDKGEQKLSVFKGEDIPVSMGLVIDRSEE